MKGNVMASMSDGWPQELRCRGGCRKGSHRRGLWLTILLQTAVYGAPPQVSRSEGQ